MLVKGTGNQISYKIKVVFKLFVWSCMAGSWGHVFFCYWSPSPMYIFMLGGHHRSKWVLAQKLWNNLLNKLSMPVIWVSWKVSRKYLSCDNVHLDRDTTWSYILSCGCPCSFHCITEIVNKHYFLHNVTPLFWQVSHVFNCRICIHLTS